MRGFSLGSARPAGVLSVAAGATASLRSTAPEGCPAAGMVWKHASPACRSRPRRVHARARAPDRPRAAQRLDDLLLPLDDAGQPRQPPRVERGLVQLRPAAAGSSDQHATAHATAVRPVFHVSPGKRVGAQPASVTAQRDHVPITLAVYLPAPASIGLCLSCLAVASGAALRSTAAPAPRRSVPAAAATSPATAAGSPAG